MTRFANRRGDWMKLSCGDRVYNKADPRHIGRVEAIRHGSIALVMWEETDWISRVPIHELVKTTDGETR